MCLTPEPGWTIDVMNPIIILRISGSFLEQTGELVLA